MKEGPRRTIVAIDGPAGSGKSTVSRLLAGRLGFHYLDTGALYRAVGWKALQEGLDPGDAPALRILCESLDLVLKPEGGGYGIQVDGQDVTGKLRTPEVSRAASAVAAVSAVRERLLGIQRAVREAEGDYPGVVVEGRDIGTVVFPDADLKFFLEASPDVRAQRRHRELSRKGLPEDLDRTRGDLQKRDSLDSGRLIAPMVPAVDAVNIDSSLLSPEEVVARMTALIGRKAGRTT